MAHRPSACRTSSTRFSKMQAFSRGEAACCSALAALARLQAEQAKCRGACPRHFETALYFAVSTLEKKSGLQPTGCGRRNSAEDFFLCKKTCFSCMALSFLARLQRPAAAFRCRGGSLLSYGVMGRLRDSDRSRSPGWRQCPPEGRRRRSARPHLRRRAPCR